MRLTDVPCSTTLGTAPADLNSLSTLLHTVFPDRTYQPFRYVAFLKNRNAPCRLFSQNEFPDVMRLEHPIATLDALAKELVRIQNEISYRHDPQKRPVCAWEFKKVENIDGLGIVAIPLLA